MHCIFNMIVRYIRYYDQFNIKFENILLFAVRIRHLCKIAYSNF